MKRTRQILVWACGLGLVAASAALAAGHDVALSSDGTIYQVRTGVYGTLFPNGKDTAKSNPVVALDVTRPGAPLQRLLVPGSGGSELESSPSVVFEDDSHTVFLLWQSEINIHPILELAGFDGANWSKAITITGNPFAPKTSPQFTITRDSYESPDATGNPVTRHRTLLHLIWQEVDASNQLETYYTPVVINDGVYIGWNPVYNLDDFQPPQNPALAAGPAIQSSVLAVPVVQSGRDDRTVLVAYGSPARGQLTTIEVDVLPEQLMQLADDARSHIIDIGRQSYPSDVAGLAEKARSHIIDIGVAFYPEIAQSLGDQVKAQILADTSGDLATLAEKARSHIIDIGAKFSGRGLRSPNAALNGANPATALVEVDDTPNASPPDATVNPYHLLQIRVASGWPAPPSGLGTVKLFVSQTGQDMIVSWALADRILYRNSQPGGWSDPRTLLFSDSLDINKAYDILDQRVQHR
ncbi:MAG TPA: hypothetical protein VGH73_18020 [Thermoanaerobaculia bacterium]|jgi:hypothetical protein